MKYFILEDHIHWIHFPFYVQFSRGAYNLAVLQLKMFQSLKFIISTNSLKLPRWCSNETRAFLFSCTTLAVPVRVQFRADPMMTMMRLKMMSADRMIYFWKMEHLIARTGPYKFKLELNFFFTSFHNQFGKINFHFLSFFHSSSLPL